MANKTLFQSIRGALTPKADTRNEAGGKAYSLSPKHALAQLAATGCLNSTYYASADDQLEKVLKLATDVDAEFVAKTAIFSRQRAFMKDMPAVLAAVLSTRDSDLLRTVFGRVVDNGKMVRNFVQIMRSGVVGRKSLGTIPKKLVRGWIETRNDEQLFRASVGNSPSLVDLVKMVHPKPTNVEREAFLGYLLGRSHNAELLPSIVKQFEAYKSGRRTEVPDVAFQMLTSLELGKAEWTAIAKRASWQMTRMNLNTFARHGVFDDKDMVKLIARRLADPKLVKRARAFPYQLLTAFKSAGKDVPNRVRNAIQDAMEVATQNVPAVEGRVYICPDVSGSMGCSATGYRQGATSIVRCIDVAALMTASILRKNRNAEVLPFESRVVDVNLNARDSVMTNADKLARMFGGGTNCSAPITWMNKKRVHADLVVFVSDNESWVDAKSGRGTETMRQWDLFKQRNPQARLVCIDVQPYGTVQAAERDDVLNIGGFSDQVFSVVSAFAEGRLGADHWVGEIESVQL